MRFRRTIVAIATGAIASTSLSEPVLAQVPTPGRSDAFQARCVATTIGKALGVGVTLTGVEVVSDGVPRCQVQGGVTTHGEGAPDGAARFELNLPFNWNHKFLFVGGGGFDGNVPKAPMPQLAKGYATLATDSGHVGSPKYPGDGLDASWAVKPDASRADARIADYDYRSRHQVNIKVRPAVGAFYDAAISHAYFMGCSGGGREALVEAERWPESYDGFVAGDPVTRPDALLLGARNFRVLARNPIPYSQFAAIDRAVMDDCDARDGVRDGLIQNPAACSFDPKSLVKSGVLTAGQAHALTLFLSAAKDSRGRIVASGNSPTGLGDVSTVASGAASGVSGLSSYLSKDQKASMEARPWGPLPGGPVDWMLYNGGISSLGLAKPSVSILDPSVSNADGVLSADIVNTVAPRLREAAVRPAQMGKFFASGRKLLIYHGFDDTILDPYSTLKTYYEMTLTGGGLAKTRGSARLFMVPNMGHCFAGSGPNAFDALGAMEAWVEHGQAPDGIVAMKFKDNRPVPGEPIERTMPLCAFPEAARYKGEGDLNAAENWTCDANDTRLLKAGPNGVAAGIAPILQAFK